MSEWVRVVDERDVLLVWYDFWFNVKCLFGGIDNVGIFCLFCGNVDLN